MDFARKQLEKYGWTDGKGLGKHENGISEALKPKLKRSVTGVGHDPAAEFNEHWWSALYDKAAQNVEVEEKNGKTKKIKTKDSEDFVISSSTWKINQKQSTNKAQYSGHFVRTEVLTNDKSGRKTENVKESESEEEEPKDVFKMTDEELFAACEGRTAHKGARHGLKAIGKLARIAKQEQMLLVQPQYEGYSHAKRLKDKAIDQMTIENEQVSKPKKKKKRKRCISSNEPAECESDAMTEKNKKIREIELVDDGLSKEKKKRKSKLKEYSDALPEKINNENDGGSNVDNDCKKSKKKRKVESASVELENEVSDSKIKKKKKKARNEEMDC